MAGEYCAALWIYFLSKIRSIKKYFLSKNNFGILTFNFWHLTFGFWHLAFDIDIDNYIYPTAFIFSFSEYIFPNCIFPKWTWLMPLLSFASLLSHQIIKWQNWTQGGWRGEATSSSSWLAQMTKCICWNFVPSSSL